MPPILEGHFIVLESHLKKEESDKINLYSNKNTKPEFFPLYQEEFLRKCKYVFFMKKNTVI